MNRKRMLTLSVMLFAAISALLSANQNALALLPVQDGKPLATIVVASDASLQVKQAAQTLQQYIAQSSGATLPISTTAEGNAINVGYNTCRSKNGR